MRAKQYLVEETKNLNLKEATKEELEREKKKALQELDETHQVLLLFLRLVRKEIWTNKRRFEKKSQTIWRVSRRNLFLNAYWFFLQVRIVKERDKRAVERELDSVKEEYEKEHKKTYNLKWANRELEVKADSLRYFFSLLASWREPPRIWKWLKS